MWVESPSVSDVRELLRTTFAGANQIVQRLVDLKILAEITGRARNRRFRYDAYCDFSTRRPARDPAPQALPGV